MLRAAHQIEGPVRFELLARKTYAQSERPIMISQAGARAIRGDRANAPNPKECLGGWRREAFRCARR